MKGAITPNGNHMRFFQRAQLLWVMNLLTMREVALKRSIQCIQLRG